MLKDYRSQSALAHWHLQARTVDDPGRAGVWLCERALGGQLVLRGNVRSEKLKKAVEQCARGPLPRKPNTVTQAGNGLIFWLGPDEWLLVVANGREAVLMSNLRDALAGQHFALTDVSDSRTVIGLGGTHARELLMKGCSLDLHPRAFGAGHCAQTRLARCQVLLHPLDETPAYGIYVHRSFADYLWRWLEDAAREYGLAVTDSRVPPARPSDSPASA